MVYFGTICPRGAKETEENHQNYQSRQSVSQPRIETGATLTQGRRVNVWPNLLGELE
jgi:hypothetical protein